MTDVTTRRAIEVCLSRLRMNGNARDALCGHLSTEMESPATAPDEDVDALRARLERVVYSLDGIDASFPKAAMLSRISSARNIARFTE